MSQSKPVRRKQAFEVEPLNWVAPKKAARETDAESKTEQPSEHCAAETA
ncbi:hypothetical protein [Alcaligenes sp. WGS1538]